MKYRKLRIAWSVAWGIVAVLLIVLWVRSYWWSDSLAVPVPYSTVGGISYCGSLILGEQETSDAMPWHWSLRIQDYPWLPDEMDKHRDPWGIGLVKSPGGLRLEVPHFVAIIVVSLVAIGAWREWRFSLRTLLIATTLVAVGLGLIVWL